MGGLMFGPQSVRCAPPTLEMLSWTTWAKTCARGRNRYATSSARTSLSFSVARQQAVAREEPSRAVEA
jgi:hypothetical protein